MAQREEAVWLGLQQSCCEWRSSGAEQKRFSAHGFSPPLAFQAMRFPPKSYNKDLESAEVSSRPLPAGSRMGPASFRSSIPNVGLCFPGAPGARAAGPGVRKGDGRGR